MSDEQEVEVDDPEWVYVGGCTCNAIFLGPGGHESYCGWEEVTQWPES